MQIRFKDSLEIKKKKLMSVLKSNELAGSYLVIHEKVSGFRYISKIILLLLNLLISGDHKVLKLAHVRRALVIMSRHFAGESG